LRLPQFQDHNQVIVHPESVMHGGDIRVIQACLEPDLAEESSRLAASGLTPAGQYFHGILSAGQGVFNPVDLPHPAGTEGADDR
jgi:hypothetical protein